jgi:hypothetical protein
MHAVAQWKLILPGQRFGDLIFLGPAKFSHIGRFQCSCGKIAEFWIRNVLIYGTKSCGCKNKPFVGPHTHSNAVKLKISSKKKGVTFSVQHRQSISVSLCGRKLSLCHKRKLALQSRLLWVERALHGVKTKVDRGATEFFNNLNQTQGFHIQHPNVYFPELGYFADGYDPILHAWFEYDTPSHLTLKYRVKDVKRQQEINDHFISIGKPLSAFYRINETGRGEPGMKKSVLKI